MSALRAQDATSHTHHARSLAHWLLLTALRIALIPRAHLLHCMRAPCTMHQEVKPIIWASQYDKYVADKKAAKQQQQQGKAGKQ